jgi:quercetin dioxygenase-like cupin family protein
LFYKANQDGYKIVLPGIKLKTLVYGEKTLFTEFRMDAGSVLPKHAHIHEQTGYLIEGKIRLTIGEQVFEVKKGDCWSIPGNMEHGAEILKDSVAIEVFSPVRDEYIPRKVK